MHIVVLRHYEKSDPDAIYYGSLREAVRAVEPGTRLFSVWGGGLNAELARFEPEDISEDFLAAWIAVRRAHLAEHYWSGEAKHEYGANDDGLACYLHHALCPPEFVLANNFVVPGERSRDPGPFSVKARTVPDIRFANSGTTKNTTLVPEEA